MEDSSTIRIAISTKKRLCSIMKYGDTINSKINDLLDLYDTKSGV